MSEQKKVLLLTYYWPPAGGAGVQRWLKMSKILSQHIQLSVYFPKNADYPIKDESLISQIPGNIKLISKPIREPYALASKINPKNKNYQKGMIEDQKNQSILSKISLWIRANYFIPDARSGWIQPSYLYLKKHLKTNPQDIIITTGPPHSMHVIGLKLKQEFPNLKWIADFRDPWTAIDYFDKLPLNKKSLEKHINLERKVLKTADIVSTVSPAWADDLSKISDRKIEIIYNGFDQEDFKIRYNPENKFSLTYIGSLNDDRNPSNLWRVLDKLCENHEFQKDFELHLVGSISPMVKTQIQSLSSLNIKTKFRDYIPHNESLITLQKSQVLLLIINQTANEKGIIPGKFFEYLASQRKILCIGKKNSNIADLLNELSAGNVVDRENEEEMTGVLLQYYKEFKNQKLNFNEPKNIKNFSREYAAFQFLKLIESL